MTETKTGAEYISEAHVRHIMRYVQARDWLSDMSYEVLDAACGTGYGTRLLSKYHKVLGIDLDADAIAEARIQPTSHECQFLQDNLLTTGRHFFCGAIVSIETLEHFSEEDGETLLNNFYRWLPKMGILIISTPYCLMSGPSPITKQHLWEYSLTDFERVLSLAGFSVELIKTERHEGKAGRLGYAMAKAIKR
jgi:cyclopropane fatty-acyl-phospholipid synthase-like methyltransferase